MKTQTSSHQQSTPHHDEMFTWTMPACRENCVFVSRLLWGVAGLSGKLSAGIFHL